MLSRSLIRKFSIQSNIKKRVCVVGGGPAGFYAAQYIIKHLPDSCVDIIEKLPVPFGLVRFGVAPDHPEVKNVINTFSKTAENPHVRFLGNLTLGTDVTLNQLRNSYHAVLLTYGADKDRVLGIPNEDKVISARDFVAWYNGLPGAQNLKPNLNGRTATLLGQGNVAVDVARMLLSPIDLLKSTDITAHALDALSESKIEEVYLVGRRGPLQTAFTIKELREMLKLKGCSTVWRNLDFDGISGEVLTTMQRPRKRLTELMLKSLEESRVDAKTKTKKFYPIFYRSPKAVTSDGIELGITRVDNDTAVETGDSEHLKCDVIFRSIGYKSINVDDEINFDEKRGFVKNVCGRVLKKSSEAGDYRTIDTIEDKFENGLYVTGWLGTGPTGVIITTMNNSFSVADTICNDFINGKIPSAMTDNKPGLNLGGLPVVTWDKWLKIDAAEVDTGKKCGKPREKILEIEKMLSIAGV